MWNDFTYVQMMLNPLVYVRVVYYMRQDFTSIQIT